MATILHLECVAVSRYHCEIVQAHEAKGNDNIAETTKGQSAKRCVQESKKILVYQIIRSNQLAKSG